MCDVAMGIGHFHGWVLREVKGNVRDHGVSMVLGENEKLIDYSMIR